MDRLLQLSMSGEKEESRSVIVKGAFAKQAGAHVITFVVEHDVLRRPDGRADVSKHGSESR